MKNKRYLSLVFIFILAGCARQIQVLPPTTALAPATATSIPQTETSTAIPLTETSPAPTLDPTLFGSILQSEIQAFSLEPVASEIFTRVMNSFIADDNILEYQVLRVTIFPGNGGLLAEFTYNVRTTNPAWLEDGGAQAVENWINDKCNRFDFVTTETEFQLKNRRTCN